MKALTISVFFAATLGLLATGAGSPARQETVAKDSLAVLKGLQWLVSVQGKDGGWGQDGGETAYIRQGQRLESAGNDVANTSAVLLALLRNASSPETGPYAKPARLGLEFVLRHIEQSPEEGLAVTSITGSQIQRKLGPYIDTFLSSMLLGELDGRLKDPGRRSRVRRSLEKCVRKIENHQLKDGSWNISGGWAPILGTSMASRSLDVARQKGVKVDEVKMARVDNYTKATAGVVGGVPGGVVAGVIGLPSAGLPSASPAPLYKAAQELEQLSRTEKDRKSNAIQISAIAGSLSDAAFVRGYGSMGGEEFFSYLNISDSLRRAGGPEWEKWNSKIKTQLVSLQNEDGTWVGHHCITGRVAVTSAAILTLAADKQPSVPAQISRK